MKIEGFINDFNDFELGITKSVCKDESLGTANLIVIGFLLFSITFVWKYGKY